MPATPPAVLLELDPVTVVVAVLGRYVVAPLALGAFERHVDAPITGHRSPLRALLGGGKYSGEGSARSYRPTIKQKRRRGGARRSNAAGVKGGPGPSPSGGKARIAKWGRRFLSVRRRRVHARRPARHWASWPRRRSLGAGVEALKVRWSRGPVDRWVPEEPEGVGRLGEVPRRGPRWRLSHAR
jgi:hypothetical protein